MKTKILLSLSFILLFSGCAGIRPGSDKIVVRAEQTRAAALETFNAFVTFEYNNRVKLWRVSNDIKHTADDVRAFGKPAIEELSKSIETYKALRNDVNADSLNKEIIAVTELLNRATIVYTKGKMALQNPK